MERGFGRRWKPSVVLLGTVLGSWLGGILGGAERGLSTAEGPFTPS